MDDRDGFLQRWRTAWREGEDALHAGDGSVRLRTWSSRDPVTLFGAWWTAVGTDEVRATFDRLASGAPPWRPRHPAAPRGGRRVVTTRRHAAQDSDR